MYWFFHQSPICVGRMWRSARARFVLSLCKAGAFWIRQWQVQKLVLGRWISFYLQWEEALGIQPNNSTKDSSEMLPLKQEHTFTIKLLLIVIKATHLITIDIHDSPIPQIQLILHFNNGWLPIELNYIEFEACKDLYSHFEEHSQDLTCPPHLHLDIQWIYGTLTSVLLAVNGN